MSGTVTLKQKLLFVTYGGGHVAMLLPVMTLARDAGFDVQVIALTTARSAVADAGFAPIGFADLYEFAAPGARDCGVQLCAGMDDSGPVSRDESIAYHGINFADLVAEHNEQEAWRRYHDQGRHAFLPTRFFTRLLEKFRPDVVIATNSPRAERAVIEASGALKIPALCTVDLFASQEVKWIGRPGYADRICVLNEHVRSFLIKSGRSADQVVVTGNPAFERHFTADARSGGKALKHRFGWSDDRRTILWASQPEPAVHPFSGRTGDPSLPRRIETTLRQFVAAHDGWRLVIRYHPSEQIAFVPAPNVDFSSPGDRLEYLLNAVDLVIVTASTVGLEAAILGLPVLSLDCSVSTPDTLFSERGVSIGVGTVAELPGAIVEQGMKMDGEHSGEAKAAFLMPDHPAQAILAQVEGLIAR
jgi:hypothetical protein